MSGIPLCFSGWAYFPRPCHQTGPESFERSIFMRFSLRKTGDSLFCLLESYGVAYWCHAQTPKVSLLLSHSGSHGTKISGIHCSVLIPRRNLPPGYSDSPWVQSLLRFRSVPDLLPDIRATFLIHTGSYSCPPRGSYSGSLWYIPSYTGIRCIPGRYKTSSPVHILSGFFFLYSGFM